MISDPSTEVVPPTVNGIDGIDDGIDGTDDGNDDQCCRDSDEQQRADELSTKQKSMVLFPLGRRVACFRSAAFSVQPVSIAAFTFASRIARFGGAALTSGDSFLAAQQRTFWTSAKGRGYEKNEKRDTASGSCPAYF